MYHCRSAVNALELVVPVADRLTDRTWRGTANARARRAHRGSMRGDRDEDHHGEHDDDSHDDQSGDATDGWAISPPALPARERGITGEARAESWVQRRRAQWIRRS